MITIKTLTEYDPKLAKTMGKLLADLSPKDPGTPVDKQWIDDIIASPWHDQLLAFDGDELVGMATMSTVFGPHMGRNKNEPDLGGPNVGRNAYLEDTVVSAKHQGKGIGSKLWAAIVEWGEARGYKRLEFTTSGKDKKTGAVGFYIHKGAEIRDTNPFRLELNKK